MAHLGLDVSRPCRQAGRQAGRQAAATKHEILLSKPCMMISRDMRLQWPTHLLRRTKHLERIFKDLVVRDIP